MAKEFEAGCAAEDCSTCGCDCGQNGFHEGAEGQMTVTLTLEDDSELECIVLTTFEAVGNQYIALLPTNPPEGEEPHLLDSFPWDDPGDGPGLDFAQRRSRSVRGLGVYGLD